MKKCFKCNVMKPINEFYPHKRMKDGHLNKCIVCTKKYEKERRQGSSREKILSYDRKRYRENDARKKQVFEMAKQWRADNPERYKAHTLVNNALQSGRLVKMPCFVCGSIKVEAHHPYYDPPLEVVWLCASHHKLAHSLIKE